MTLLANTTAAQDRAIRNLEDTGGAIRDALEAIEDLDSRLTSALTEVSNLRDEIRDLEAQLYEARNGGEA